MAKLDWLNGRYIRERLDAASFVRRVEEWAVSPERLTRIAQLAAPRIERLSDLGPLLAFLFSGPLAADAQSFAGSKLDELAMRRALTLALRRVRRAAGLERSRDRTVRSSASPRRSTRKTRDVARPFYVAITGSPTSIPLYDSMELLGRDLVRERLRNALDVLGGAVAV